MKRETVEVILESALSDAEAGHATSTIAPRLLAALCRRWLAVEDADSMQVLTGPRGFGEIVCMPSLIGQRVRIVPEAGQGGGE